MLYGVCGLLGVLFVTFLWGDHLFTALELDLWWQVPLLSQSVHGKSWWELFTFLLKPGPLLLAQPIGTKAYPLLVLSVLDLHGKGLVLASLPIHFGNAALLFLLSRQLGFSRRAALISAMVYGSLFAHFHALLWMTAVQHLIAVFSILVVLCLYLKTEQLMAAQGKAGHYPLFAFLAGGVASLQRTCVIAPVLILLHLLVCSKDRQERLARYDRWLPLLAISPIYFLLGLTFVGLERLNMTVVAIPLPAIVKFLLLFSGATGGLLLVRAFLRRSSDSLQRKAIPWAMGILLTGVLIFFLQDKRHLFLPYNVLTPLATLFSSFLEPMRAAMLLDSTQPFYYLHPQVSLFGVFVTVSFLGIFVRAFGGKRAPLVLLSVWYLIPFLYLFEQNSSFPLHNQSRYFIYLSPVFAVLFGSVFDLLYSRLTERSSLSPFNRNMLLAVMMLILCIPNEMAIRVARIRGRLVNTFPVYEDLRVASLIRSDVAPLNNPHPILPQAIRVRQIEPMPFALLTENYPEILALDPARYENFRFVVGEVFHDRSMRDIVVNPPREETGKGNEYLIQGERILDGQGRNVDPFGLRYEQALGLIGQSRYRQAKEMFLLAVRERPFLLKYLLDQHLPLSDLRWVTGGLDLREWVGKMAQTWGGDARDSAPKYRHIRSVIDQELLDYAVSVLYLSFLESRDGNEEASRFCLSQLQFLERDPETLSSWIHQAPIVRLNPELATFLQRTRDPSFFQDPLPWQKDDYGFGRFLVRFLLGMDIQSRWEKQFGQGI